MPASEQSLTPIQLQRLSEQSSRYTRPAFLLQLLLLVLLVLCPLLFQSFRVMDVVAKIMIFAVAVASFDIIIGYTGIISFAHGMFFGIGAYAVGLVAYYAKAPHYHHILMGLGLAVLLAVILAVVIAFFSLRVKAIFFAMMTLAVAEFAHILGYQWSSLTKGEDGVSFKMPGIFNVNWSDGSILGVPLNGRLVTYYFILIVSVLLFVGIVRFVRSPAGRVLKGIRDNEQRATALGYRIFRYRMLSTVFGSTISAVCGGLFAMWLNYVNPDTVLGIPLMLNILLMVIVGGLGTIYGGIVGAAFINIAETWLPDLQKVTASLFPGWEVLQRLSERWVLYFGILYVLVVLFFPKGLLGSLRDMAARRKAAPKLGGPHA
jgi:branched-chain amino acid transport system permease protein